MAYLILHNQEKIIPKVLTIDTTYTYLSGENQKMEVSLYINHKHHPINDQQAYQFIYLSDQEKTKRIEVELINIKKGHFETYLHETYQQITLYFKLPYISANLDMMDAYLNITLINQANYQFFLGDFFYSNIYSDGEFLDWTGLHGLKEENQFISRLKTIIIPFTHLEKEIENISLGTTDFTTFKIEEKTLHLTIEKRSQLLFNVPLIITYHDQSIQTISNFRYFIDYQTLKESGPMVNIYALN